MSEPRRIIVRLTPRGQDAVENGLRLYAFVAEAMQNGAKVMVQHPGGPDETVRFL